jgi:hypothetical protein
LVIARGERRPVTPSRHDVPAEASVDGVEPGRLDLLPPSSPPSHRLLLPLPAAPLAIVRERTPLLLLHLLLIPGFVLVVV